MTDSTPLWANQLDASPALSGRFSGTNSERRTVVLVDASLLRERDRSWVNDIESKFGAVVAICADPAEAQWARANGVDKAAPATLLSAKAEIALDVLADILTENVDFKTCLERFMCDAVHEFRTPLTVISEFAALCEDGVGGPLTERQHAYVGYIQSAVERMGEQFDDYRDGLRMRLGTLQHTASTEEIGGAVSTTSESMGAVFSDGDGLGSSCLDGVDEERLAVAVKRLIGGAQKLSSKGKQVHVELVKPDGANLAGRPCVEIHVRYQGVVLSGEDVAVMNDGVIVRSNGFYRSVARVFGLGVSMARLFLSQSGGTTRLELTEGIGGTFIAQVPVKAAVPLVGAA